MDTRLAAPFLILSHWTWLDCHACWPRQIFYHPCGLGQLREPIRRSRAAEFPEHIYGNRRTDRSCRRPFHSRTRAATRAYVAGAWLLLVAVNLVLAGHFDVAVRDAVMSIAAFTLACAIEVQAADPSEASREPSPILGR